MMIIPERKKGETFDMWIKLVMDEVPIRSLDDDDLFALLARVEYEGYKAGSDAMYETLKL